jgi:hypothetical protein
MTTPPPISPDAQAVSDAFAGVARGIVYNWEAGLAAAIRAAVEQAIPHTPLNLSARGTRHWHRGIREDEIRLALLAIAAELEGGNTTTTQETDR